MNKNYIILNGKRYNAVTGELIASVAPKKAMDATAPITHTKPSMQSPAITSQPKPVKRDRAHHNTTAKLTPRQPKKATTLMRHAVKKPGNDQHKSLKKTYPITHASSNAITPKKSVNAVDASKVHRAAQIKKSSKVNRFGAAVKSPVRTQVQPIALRPAPKTTHHTTARPPISQTTKQPHPYRHIAAPSKPIETKKQHASAQIKKQRLLEQALKNAVSHEQPEHTLERLSASKRKFLSSFAVLGAVLIIGSFVMYLNRSSVELQVASVRAGFQASAPAAPSGYERQTASANNGKVDISFVAPQGNDSFTLTQESSGWDSQTLFDSVVASDSNTYQTIQSHGRTIYVYDGDKAAWVDGGILYKVSGSKQLDSDQIVSLATSM